MIARETLRWNGVALLPVLALVSVVHAQDEPNVISQSGSGALPAASPLDFQADLFTGRFTTSVPIEVPPARQQSEPRLGLSYASSSSNSWVGVGWSLDAGYIQRDGDKGVPVMWSDPADDPDEAYDDAKGFVFSLNGVSSKLVEIDAATDTWAARVESAFIRFQLDRAAGHWMAIDKKGSRYFFGDTTDARMEHPAWGGTPVADRTFRWSLSRSETANGVLVEYSYFIDDAENDPVSGQPYRQQYLSEVRYNGHAGGYPASHRVRFTLEDRPIDRYFSYRSGYRIQTRKRLSTIDVELSSQPMPGPPDFDVPVRRYRLIYGESPSTGRSRLESIQEYAVDPMTGNDLPITLPASSFTYQDQVFEFHTTEEWGTIIDDPDLTCSAAYMPYWRAISATGINCAGQDGASHLGLFDWDRDGFPDRVSIDVGNPAHDTLLIQFNDGKGAGPAATGGQGLESGFIPIQIDNSEFSSVGGGSVRLNSVGTDSFHDILTLDFNGDGYLDRISNFDDPAPLPGDGTRSELKVQCSNQGLAFQPVPDVVTNVDNQTNVNEKRNSPEYQETHSYNVNSTTGATDVRGFSTFADMNGDGKIDRVMRELNGSQGGVNGQYDVFLVQYNDGAGGFEEPREWPIHSQGATDIGWGSVQFTTETGCISNCCNQAIRWVETKVLMTDMNGDGLPDRVERERTASQAGNPGLYDALMIEFNTGTGFEPAVPWPITSQGQTAAAWGCPVGVKKDTRCPPQRRYGTVATLTDVNGDGLTDRLMATPDPDDPGGEKFVVQLNTGAGFAAESDYLGLEGGAADQLFAPNYRFGTEAIRTIADMMDMNGDGLIDRIVEQLYDAGDPTPSFNVQLAKGPFPDLMASAHNGLGDPAGATDPAKATVQIQYVPSTRYDNRDILGRSNPWADGCVNLLPMVVQTVSMVTTRDGMGEEFHAFYDYAGGFFHPTEREFRGFHRVETRDDFGTRTITYFHQGGGVDGSSLGEHQDASSKAKQGTPFRVEHWGADDKLYRLEVMKVMEDDLGNGRCYAQTVQTTTLDYEGADDAGGEYRATMVQTHIDPFTGNLASQVEFGEIAAFSPQGHGYTPITPTAERRTTEYCYYDPLPGNPDIIDAPRTVRTYDGNNNRLRETRFTYDDRGNTLQKIRLVKPQAGTNALTAPCDGMFLPGDDQVMESFVYDDDMTGFGSYNLTEVTDVTGSTRKLIYDLTYFIFPERTRYDSQGFNYVERRCYDPRSGDVLAAKDIKGLWTIFEYDDSYRMTSRSVVPIETGSVTGCGTSVTGEIVVEERSYNLGGTGPATTSNWVEVRSNDAAAGASPSFHVARTYMDGLGRSIQITKEFDFADSQRRWRVADMEYDDRGQLRFESLAYFSGSNVYTPMPFGQDGTTTDYDAVGRAISTVPPAGDGANSPTGATSIAYKDATGATLNERLWTEVTTDPTGRVTKRRHNAFGRPIEIVEINGPDSYVTSYGYDRQDNLNSIQDHYENPPTTLTYDALSRKKTMSDPDMGGWAYDYDPAGRISEQTDAKSQVVRTYRDTMGRLTRRDVFESGGTMLEEYCIYKYDSAPGSSPFTVYPGQLYEVAHYDGQDRLLDRVRHGYDSRGREIRQAVFIAETGQSYVTRWEYDDAGRITKIIYPRGVVVRQAFGDHGLLVSVDAVYGGTTSRIYEANDYDEFDRVTQVTFDNGITTTFGYYANSKRLQSIVAPGIQNLQYRYDEAANLTRIDDLLRADSDPHDLGMTGITYDGLHRLTSYFSVSAGQSFHFGYNAVGNMKRNDETGAGMAEDYAYDGSGHAHGQPHAATSANQRSYAYDANGNMTMRQTGPVASPITQTLQYNALNQLERVTDDDAPALDVRFGYNADGMRLWKRDLTSGTLTAWVNNIFEIRDGTPYYHVFAGEERICTIEEVIRIVEVQGAVGMKADDDEQPAGPLLGAPVQLTPVAAFPPQLRRANPQQRPSSYRLWYYHPDHLGSNSTVTNGNGIIVQKRVFRAFGTIGEETNSSPFDPSNLFTDQVRDKETGLDYFGGRYFDPDLGRFAQADPLVPSAEDPQSLNRYSYVLNNPIRLVDPSGFSDEPHEDVGAGSAFGYDAAGREQFFNWLFGADFMTQLPLVRELAMTQFELRVAEHQYAQAVKQWNKEVAPQIETHETMKSIASAGMSGPVEDQTFPAKPTEDDFGIPGMRMKRSLMIDAAKKSIRNTRWVKPRHPVMTSANGWGSHYLQQVIDMGKTQTRFNLSTGDLEYIDGTPYDYPWYYDAFGPNGYSWQLLSAVGGAVRGAGAGPKQVQYNLKERVHGPLINPYGPHQSIGSNPADPSADVPLTRGTRAPRP